MTLLWITSPSLCNRGFTIALTTLRRPHRLFWFGIVFPVLWIIGAMQPTAKVAAAGVQRCPAGGVVAGASRSCR
jgi:hypothetical protein